jgi:hypothetical protein
VTLPGGTLGYSEALLVAKQDIDTNDLTFTSIFSPTYSRDPLDKEVMASVYTHVDDFDEWPAGVYGLVILLVVFYAIIVIFHGLFRVPPFILIDIS